MTCDNKNASALVLELEGRVPHVGYQVAVACDWEGGEGKRSRDVS